MTRYAVLPLCLVALARTTSADQEGEGEEACALQVHHAKQVKAADDQTCAVGDHVPCPGSGNMCAGEQCCPRIGGVNGGKGGKGNEGKTFPCPSAPPGWSMCEQPTKESNCLVLEILPPTFLEQCAAWTAGDGLKPSTCEGSTTDGCYKGGPPVSPADGAWCVDGKLTTCEKYCNATGLCPTDFCGSPTFLEQCAAWTAGDGLKPSTCEGSTTDGCYKGGPPVSLADGAWCVDGKLTTCEKYCNATGLCPTDFCDPPTFVEQCEAWVAGGLKPSTCEGSHTPADGCYKGGPPVSPADGAWCVDGKLTTCEKYTIAIGNSPTDFCASVRWPYNR